ncbi:MAG: PEP-CTERM sorting domain-containing protein [Planctomycetaceae bacterium]|nr:PEP-CTERM sorting domain-containing protein [Planctomycetaceae bacterium]
MRKVVMVLVCASMVSMAQGVSITNGDFETGGGSNLDNVTGWFDYNPGNFWESSWQTNAGWITPNGTNVVVFSSFQSDDFGMPSTNSDDGGYLYQSIGTADGLTPVQIGFDWGAPNDDPGGRQLGLTVGIYAYDGLGGFTAADGIDVRGAAGVILLDSVSFTMTSTGVDGLIVNAAASLDISGAGSQELFLRFNGYNAGTTESWPILDNVTIVPEPASMLLLALGGLLLKRRG